MRIVKLGQAQTLILFAVLIVANVAAWVWAFALFADRPRCWAQPCSPGSSACAMRSTPTISRPSTMWCAN